MSAEHGTWNGYNNRGCRCDDCRRAAADYQRERYHRLGLRRPRGEYLAAVRAEAEARDNHGTEGRYKLGCRCEACRAAAAGGRKRRRHADLEAARAYDRMRWHRDRRPVA